MREWIGAYCLGKKGVVKAFKPEWNMTLFLLFGKIFAELGNYRDGRPILTVKLEPAFSELLRAKFPGAVIPGYYCNKTHWSSMFLESDVPDETARAMLDNAYAAVLSSLPKKERAAVEAG